MPVCDSEKRWFAQTAAFQKSRELCECRVLLPIGIIVLFTELLFRLGQLAFQLFDPALIGLGTQLLLQLLLFLFLLFDFPVHLSRIAGPFFLRLIGRARCPLGVVKMDFGPGTYSSIMAFGWRLWESSSGL